MLKLLSKYDVVAVNSKRFVIKTDKHRMSLLENICEEIGGEYKKFDPHSSIGCIMKNDCRIYVKPLVNPGIDNEITFVKIVNDYIAQGCTTLKFGRTKITDVVSVEHVGALKSDNNCKADVIIHTTTRSVPVSIKKENAERWASADNTYGLEAHKTLETVQSYGLVEVDNFSECGNVKRISMPICRKMERKEINRCVFGSDIRKGKGFVIVETFTSSSFQLDGDVLKISGKLLRKSADVINTPYHPYLFIRNDSTRRSKHLPYGIRVEVVYESRITKNTLVLEDNHVT